MKLKLLKFNSVKSTNDVAIRLIKKKVKKPSLIFQPYLSEESLNNLVKKNLYYYPIVDLKDSRNRALEAYQRIKS